MNKEFAVNPNTGRTVKRGSRTWIELVKKGVIAEKYEDPNELYEYSNEIPVEKLNNLKKEFNKKLPIGKQAVKGRGKYKNKLVIRNKPLGADEVVQFTKKKAIHAISANYADLENLTTEELEAKLEELIGSEIINTKKKQKKKYTIKEETEEEEEEEESE